MRPVAPSPAIRTGLYIGLVIVILNLLAYFTSYEILVAFWYALLSLALVIGMVLYHGFRYRKDAGGYLDYGSAFNFSFVSLVVGGIVALLGNLLLYHVIDSDLAAHLAENQLESTLAILDKFGVGEGVKGDQLEEMRIGMQEAYTLWGLLKSFGWSLIIYAVMSLVLAAIIKKRDKSFDY